MEKHGYLSLSDIGYETATGFKGINCRHDWRPYYKGSTRTYTDKELKDMANETVIYNGQKIKKYDAQQMQRSIERQIRQDKKDIAGLQGILTSNNKDNKLIEKTRIDLINTQSKLKLHSSLLNDFIEQTKFRKDNSRLMVGNMSTNNNNNDIMGKITNQKENKMNYRDITSEMYQKIKTKQGKVEKQKFYTDNGKTYFVDGHNVVYKHDERELEVARLLNKNFGGNVKILPNINYPQGIKSPDYLFRGEKTDLKRITSKRANDCMKTALRNKEKQANNFIIDNTAQTVKDEDIIRQAKEIYNLKGFEWVDKIYILKDKEFIKVFKRK